jgi:hypothetical protein
MSFLLISSVNRLGCESANVDNILTYKKIFVLVLRNGAKRHLHRTFWSPQRPPDTIWSWASASIAPRSGAPSTMEATAREHLLLAAVLLVTASFNHTAVVFCPAPSSCIMLCSMHGCARDTPWHYPCSLGPRPYAGGGLEESMVWPSDIACTSSAR